MKRSLLPLLVVPALLAASELGQSVEFAPKSGLVLKKSFHQKDETALDDMTVSVNGQEQPSDMVNLEQEFSSTLDIVLVDEFVAVADGRPTRLKRTFDTIHTASTVAMSHPMMGDMTFSASGSSELVGKSVLFTWKADDEEYGVAFAHDEGDEGLLLDLTEDTDLRAFLPSGEVEEGGTWEVDPSALRDVLAFGGALKIDVEVEDAPAGMGGMGAGGQNMPTPDKMLGDLDGTITAEYRGTRDEAGTRVAVIHLQIAVSSAKDMTEIFHEMMEDMELPEGMDMEMEYNSVDVEFEIEGTGVLLWNLEGGHLHSLDLSGAVRTLMDMSMSMSMGGTGDMDVDTSLDMKGTQTITITVEAGDA